jgi:uncharacterized protein (TIGR02466 family)
MNIIKHEWWATPVWEIDTGFDAQFNKNIMKELPQLKNNSNDFNIWDYQGRCLDQLKQKIINASGNIREYFGDYYDDMNLVINRGWINTQLPGESLALHSHGGPILATTYYINAPLNSGDLLLVDPRGATNWEYIKEGKVVGIKYKRITPTAGKLVLFPAFLLHMVEVNNSDETRISLASNVINRPEKK